MNYQEKAKKIIEKFKKENNVETTVSEILIDTISESLEAIESAKNKMIDDAEITKSNDPNRKAGYGFMWSRLGDLKKHPGRDIIKDENRKILDNLKALSISSNAKPEEAKSKLSKMMEVSGGKKKSA